MGFIIFLSLEVLLMSAYVFGAESSESELISTEDMKILICDEKNAEISKVILECFVEMSVPEFSSIITQCYAGLNGDINGEVVKEWYCARSIDEITKADECSDEMIIAEKGEEFLTEAGELFGECVESKLPSDRKRK